MMCLRSRMWDVVGAVRWHATMAVVNDMSSLVLSAR